MKRYLFCFFLPVLFGSVAAAQDSVLHFVFTSDVHYGITRPHFRGGDSVRSTVVSRAMIAAINRLPGLALPSDGGVSAGLLVGHIDGVLITGDIANREENGVQPAAVSWAQFEADYDHLLHVTDRLGFSTPVLLCPGNHDVSDAIGFWRPMRPLRDATSIAGIYNRMMRPARFRTAATYNFATDKINFFRDFGGVRLVFMTCWPDSTEQAWFSAQVAGSGPVLLFAHANPDVEARFFTNPNGHHAIDSVDRFENLLPEVLQDGRVLRDSTLIEQRGFVTFLQHHPEIKAYFHGHNNWTQFYTYRGPDSSISLPCFRVDSPMKGQYSAGDETLLSFELITIDMRTRTMTVRECRWNSVPSDPAVIKWGEVKTMGL